jgi:glycosyltransferase involved in cell wall biosynthesis
VNGGAELHCRQLAERLKDIYDVEVLTTCAVDYVTWENYYKEGVEDINGITVRRFKVDKPRNMKKFSSFSAKVMGVEHSDEDEEKWIDDQGPYSTKCVEYLREHASDYHVVIFMTYLYYITARGLCMGLKNAFLLPTAHDEPPIYLNYYKKVFENASALIYNTIEERQFCEKMFDVSDTPNIIAGVGVDVPDKSALFDAREHYGLSDYILYVGRIDESKGCGTLFKYFSEYKKRNGGELKLVLVGKSVMDIPKRDDIIPLGFVSDEEKFSLINSSELLVLASEFESLSMVVLESMAYEKPVLVNGRCMVLKGHCRKSDAGLYFENYFEFEGALNYLLTHKDECAVMGRNAKKYVDENYRWDIIVKKVSSLIESYE